MLIDAIKCGLSFLAVIAILGITALVMLYTGSVLVCRLPEPNDVAEKIMNILRGDK